MIRRVLSISGGVDSTAMYLHAMEQRDCDGMDFEAVFADTGNEHPVTLDYVRELPRLAKGPEITWVKADFSEQIAKRRAYVAESEDYAAIRDRVLDVLQPTGNPFLDLCLWKGKFPNRTQRLCTIFLKILPIRAHQDAILDLGQCVESWQGVRADESEDRSKLPERNIEDDGLVIYRPILRRSKRDMFSTLRRHGIPANPLYAQGMFRVGCMPCINSRKEEIYRISRRFPEHIDRIRQWEALVSRASKNGGSTFFHKSGMSEATKASRDAVARESGIDGMVRWSQTGRGGKVYDMLKMLPLPSCQSEYGLCE